MEDNKPAPMCDNGSCDCSGERSVSRRNFIKVIGVGGASLVVERFQPIAGPFTADDFKYTLIPAKKNLSPEWLASLVTRGAPTRYTGSDLDTIGMPVPGVKQPTLSSLISAITGRRSGVILAN